MRQTYKITSRVRGRRMVLLSWAGLAGLTAALAGCMPEKSTIAQVDPYLGQRPPESRPLPPREQPPIAPPVARGGSKPGWMPPGGISNRWKCVVVHHSANDKSTPEGMRSWHMKGRGWDELGYHFVIGNGIGYGDGVVYVGARWAQQKHGAHCKTDNNFYNDHGIGICLIGNLDAHPPTPKQMEALGRLVSYLCDKTGVPASKVYTHGGVTNKTACPGRYFSLAGLKRLIAPGRTADATELASEDVFETDLGIIP